jgi:hypothetical protein
LLFPFLEGDGGVEEEDGGSELVVGEFSLVTIVVVGLTVLFVIFSRSFIKLSQAVRCDAATDDRDGEAVVELGELLEADAAPPDVGGDLKEKLHNSEAKPIRTARTTIEHPDGPPPTIAKR